MEVLEVVTAIVGYVVATVLISSKIINDKLKSYDSSLARFDKRMDELELYIRTVEAALQYNNYLLKGLDTSKKLNGEK